MAATGGSVTIRWSNPLSAQVSITRAGVASTSFTVDGVAVTFPYRLSGNTTLTTLNDGDYSLSIQYRGIEIGGTPDAAMSLSLSGGGATVIQPSPDVPERVVKDTNLAGFPIHIYGNSYGTHSAAYFTAGKHYTQLAADQLGGGAVTSYAVSGARILDVLGGLINGNGFPGCGAPVAGAMWPGTASRTGLGILESCINDFGHYPTMVGTAIPAVLPSGNTNYRDSIKGCYRSALAMMSGASRVESTGATYSGTWTQNSPQSYASGGFVSFTSVAASYVEVTVTPPQYGPLAGKVFIIGFTLDSGAGTMAQQQISVDGTLQLTRTPPAWEQYTGPGGGAVNIASDSVAVTVPIDGASHVVRVTHNGSGGQWLYFDQVLIPSETPNPIAVMGAEHKVAYTTWTAGQVGAMLSNNKTMTPDLKSVVAEFPNAFWVPSTMTLNGLWSSDLLHPNDRGMAQRANDLIIACLTLIPRLRNRELESSTGFSVL